MIYRRRTSRLTLSCASGGVVDKAFKWRSRARAVYSGGGNIRRIFTARAGGMCYVDVCAAARSKRVGDVHGVCGARTWSYIRYVIFQRSVAGRWRRWHPNLR